MNFLNQNFINKHNCNTIIYYIGNFIPCLIKSLHAFPMHACGKLKKLIFVEFTIKNVLNN